MEKECLRKLKEYGIWSENMEEFFLRSSIFLNSVFEEEKRTEDEKFLVKCLLKLDEEENWRRLKSVSTPPKKKSNSPVSRMVINTSSPRTNVRRKPQTPRFRTPKRTPRQTKISLQIPQVQQAPQQHSQQPSQLARTPVIDMGNNPYSSLDSDSQNLLKTSAQLWCNFDSDFEGSYIFYLLVDGQLSTFFSINIVRNYISVYNVCSNPSHRRQGYTRKLFEYFINICETHHAGHVIWLGVDIDNIKAINLYLSLGFTNLKLSTVMPDGRIKTDSNNIPVPFISLEINVSDRSQKQIYDNYINGFINSIQKNWNYIMSNSKRKIAIDKNFLRDIQYKLFIEPEEWGCGLVEKNGIVYALPENEWVKGSSTSFEVDLTKYADQSHFHTHPLLAYFAFKYMVGFPSPMDIYLFLKFCMGKPYDIVFSIEGIYLTQISTFFRIFMNAILLYGIHGGAPPSFFEDFLVCLRNIFDNQDWRSSLGVCQSNIVDYNEFINTAIHFENMFTLQYSDLETFLRTKNLEPHAKHQHLHEYITQTLYPSDTFPVVLKHIETNMRILNSVKMSDLIKGPNGNLIQNYLDLFIGGNIDFELFNIEFIPWKDIFNNNFVAEFYVNEYNPEGNLSWKNP
jgi:hypothetical protein